MTSILEKEFGADFLESDHVNFFTNPNGVLCMECNGTVYWKISARCAMPFQFKGEYIFFYNFDDTEIGAFRDISRLSKESRKTVKILLEKRYFTREIMNVYSIDHKFNVLLFKVKTDIKDKVDFSVVRPRDNIRRSRAGGFLVTDADNNLYHLKDESALLPKDLITIERYC